MHSYLGNTYIGAPKGPPKTDFEFLKRSSGDPWAPQGPKRETPTTPRNREKGPEGRPRVPKPPPRAPLEPKGPFERHAFLPGENEHRAPRAPKNDVIVAFRSDPTRAYRFPLGPFWRHLGPFGSKKGEMLKERLGSERRPFNKNDPRASKGPPKDPPRLPK